MGQCELITGARRQQHRLPSSDSGHRQGWQWQAAHEDEGRPSPVRREAGGARQGGRTWRAPGTEGRGLRCRAAQWPASARGQRRTPATLRPARSATLVKGWDGSAVLSMRWPQMIPPSATAAARTGRAGAGRRSGGGAGWSVSVLVYRPPPGRYFIYRPGPRPSGLSDP